jgi:hypothetical protein
VEGVMAKAAEVYQLKITLRNTKPPIWRRVQVPDCSLYNLHLIIQACMGWENCHLYSFDVGPEAYGEPDDMGVVEFKDAARTKLSRLVKDGQTRFKYTYDFGDNWEHTVQIERTLPAEPGIAYPRCIAGKRACPLEDCGGPWGYLQLLESLADPKHSDHADMLEWAGGPIDPEAFDLGVVNKELRRLG